jgi:hypothetical protein
MRRGRGLHYHYLSLTIYLPFLNLSLPVSFLTCLPICLLSASRSAWVAHCMPQTPSVLIPSTGVSWPTFSLCQPDTHSVCILVADLLSGDKMLNLCTKDLCPRSALQVTLDMWGLVPENCCMYKTTIKWEMYWLSTDQSGEGVWNDMTESKGGMT